MIQTLYKLTDEFGQTRGKTQWGPGVIHTAKGREGQPLCSNGWIHAYTHPLLAIFMNPIHGSFRNPRLWEAQGDVGTFDKTKVGCRSLLTVREIPAPIVTTAQWVAFGLLCAATVYADPGWVEWETNWLSGVDRSWLAARAAARAADAAALVIDLAQLAEKAMSY